MIFSPPSQSSTHAFKDVRIVAFVLNAFPEALFFLAYATMYGGAISQNSSSALCVEIKIAHTCLIPHKSHSQVSVLVERLPERIYWRDDARPKARSPLL